MPMHNPPHPGEALREDVLPALGMTEAEFAKPISTVLAQCLEQAGLGMASIWLAEQAAYDLWHKQQ